MDVDEMRRLGGKNSRKNVTPERAREIAQKAGKASGNARRALAKKSPKKKTS